MVSSISSAIPGSFSSDSPLTPKVDISVGPRSHIFQPPSSASGSLQTSTASLASSHHGSVQTRSRKRCRRDSRTTARETLDSTGSHDFSRMTCDDPSPYSTPGYQSPPPLANFRYRLAGGLDTPTANSASAREGRRHLDTLTQQRLSGRNIRGYDPADSDSYFPQIPPALAMERNGQARMPKSPSIRDGLGNVIYRVAGVAGKVFQNWSNTFRGFYAGGGQGYELKLAQEAANGEQSQWQAIGQNDFWGTDVPPTPGGFPIEDYIPEYMSADHTQTPPRASKRSKQDSDMTASWILVGSTTSSREASPSRLSHRKVPPPSSSTKRTIPKCQGRRPILAASRPSLSSYAGSPALHSARASYASPRSPTALSSKQESPVSKEVQRHAARLRKKEAEEDANLKRFNQQLKAMIKEGREALGTKFEVEEDDMLVEGGDIFDRDHG